MYLFTAFVCQMCAFSLISSDLITDSLSALLSCSHSSRGQTFKAKAWTFEAKAIVPKAKAVIKHTARAEMSICSTFDRTEFTQIEENLLDQRGQSQLWVQMSNHK